MPVRSLNILYNWLRDVKPQANDTLSMVYSGWALMRLLESYVAQLNAEGGVQMLVEIDAEGAAHHTYAL